MDESRLTPTFNMKVVVLETGIKPDTLRAWERRYGVPKPSRTAGGHRLYSQHQIDMLKWLLTRQREGMAIRHAIDLWQQMLSGDEDPFSLDESDVPVPMVTNHIAGETLSEMRREWLNSCLRFDEAQAMQILAQAFAQFPAEIVCFELLQKGLSRVGQLWYEGKATIQQEHFCSSLAVRQLEALLAACARPTKDVRIIAACPPLEQHTFGLLLLTFLFRRQGWDVVYLGANVPIDRLDSIVKSVDPDLVVISAQTLLTASMTLPMAKYIVGMEKLVAFGGAIFSYLEDARRFVPGHFLGDSLADVPDKIRQIIKEKRPILHVDDLPQDYKTAVSHFASKRGDIEGYVEKNRNLATVNPKFSQGSNRELGNNILAALKLGDINLLTANINWVKGLLMNSQQQVPDQILNHYMELYFEGIKLHLGEDGRLIIDWFEKLLKSFEMTHKWRTENIEN